MLATAASAQTTLPDPAAVVESLDKQTAHLASAWLHRADPRMQAWGAYIVLRDRHTEAIPDLLEMLAQFQIVEEPVSQTDIDQRDAMLGVLDALIQLVAQVPVGDAQRIYAELPVQSLILLSRSQEDAVPALLAIFKSERRWPAAWLAAGAMLLERRADGFAAAVIGNMTVHAEVVITEPGVGYGSGGASNCCGAASAPKPKEGWPSVGVYAFGGCADRVQPGATLLAGGSDPAYYQRHVTANYQVYGISACGCSPDQDLVRQHYLTRMLSDSPDHPPVRAHVSHTIPWKGPEAYQSDLAAFLAEQQTLFLNQCKKEN